MANILFTQKSYKRNLTKEETSTVRFDQVWHVFFPSSAAVFRKMHPILIIFNAQQSHSIFTPSNSK
jgi:hypothetical protein